MQSYGQAFSGVYNVHWKGFSESFAPVIHAAIGEIPEKTLLDLCCGTGQLCRYFLEHGYRVTGLDLSRDMLRHAIANNQAHVDSGEFTAVHGNAVDFAVSERFSVVTSLFDALNHLENEAELAGCFESAFRALREDGVFFFDLNTIKGLDGWNFNDVKEQADLVLVQRGMFIEEKKKAYMEILGFRDTGGGRYERFKELMFNTAFAMRDVESLLGRTGFRTVCTHKANKAFEIAEDPEMESRVFFEARKG